MSHTQEPWEVEEDDNGSIIVSGRQMVNIGYHEEAFRIVACVNACAGMIDPAAEINAMREQLAQCLAEKHGKDRHGLQWTPYEVNE
jgi:hypothetical protein